MKATFFLTLLSVLSIQRLDAQKIQRKDAAGVINFMDTITRPLQPSANNLVAYFQKSRLLSNEKSNYKLSAKQVDSLKEYYNILLKVYNYAIMKTNQNKTIDKFAGLKSDFQNLLTEGQKPWFTLMPLYIKMFSKGITTLSASEQNLLNQTGAIFTNSGNKTLEYAKIIATREEEIEKKFHLELHNNLYR